MREDFPQQTKGLPSAVHLHQAIKTLKKIVYKSIEIEITKEKRKQILFHQQQYHQYISEF